MIIHLSQLTALVTKLVSPAWFHQALVPPAFLPLLLVPPCLRWFPLHWCPSGKCPPALVLVPPALVPLLWLVPLPECLAAPTPLFLWLPRPSGRFACS